MKYLVSEAKENRALLEVSTWVSLKTDAWSETKRSGIAMDFKKELREKLVTLYSRITEKNDLLLYQRIGIQIQRELGVSGGQKPKSLTQVIGDLSTSLKKKIDDIIPLLEKELDC